MDQPMAPPPIRTAYVKLHASATAATPGARHFARLVLVSAGLLFASLQAGSAGPAFVQCGKASWYALTSMTASGERADPDAMAAAHRTLPFGTLVKVANLRNGREITVRINDRGPFVKGRVIDVTRAAAGELGFRSQGVTRVRITVAGADGTARDLPACGK